MNLKPPLSAAERAVESVAERNAKWLRSEDVKALVSPRNILIAVLALGWIATCALAKHSGKRDAELSIEQIAAQYLHDTVRVVNDRVKVETLTVRANIKPAVDARTKYDTARAKVLKASEGSAAELPVTLVLPAIRLCDSALVKAAVLDSSRAVAFRDAMTRGDALQRQLDATDDLLKHAKRSRFGMVASFVAGAVSIVLLRVALK